MRQKVKFHLALYEQQKVGPLLVVASAFSGLNDLKKKKKKKKKLHVYKITMIFLYIVLI